MSLGLQNALNTGDLGLVRLALEQGLRPTPEHLATLLKSMPLPEPALVRLLVQHGANPHHGSPSAIQTAQRRQLFALAWTMQSAWMELTAQPSSGNSVP